MIGSLANFNSGLKIISLTLLKAAEILVFSSCPPKPFVIKPEHGDNEGESAEGTTNADSSPGSCT